MRYLRRRQELEFFSLNYVLALWCCWLGSHRSNIAGAACYWTVLSRNWFFYCPKPTWNRTKSWVTQAKLRSVSKAEQPKQNGRFFFTKWDIFFREEFFFNWRYFFQNGRVLPTPLATEKRLRWSFYRSLRK